VSTECLSYPGDSSVCANIPGRLRTHAWPPKLSIALDLVPDSSRTPKE